LNAPDFILLKGKIDFGDKSLFDAASREFDEETHGFFGREFLGNISSNPRFKAVSKSLWQTIS
jgi:hypothetical protein